MSRNGLVVWMTGRPGSGKSTLAHLLRDKLKKEDIRALILDGAILRSGLNNDLGYTDNDREENIRRAAEVAKIISENGIIAIVAMITPFQKLREKAKNIIGDDYFEVYIESSVEHGKNRNDKGLYKKETTGEMNSYTDVSSKFENPASPDLIINTDNLSEEQSLEALMAAISGRIFL